MNLRKYIKYNCYLIHYLHFLILLYTFSVYLGLVFLLLCHQNILFWVIWGVSLISQGSLLRTAIQVQLCFWLKIISSTFSNHVMRHLMTCPYHHSVYIEIIIWDTIQYCQHTSTLSSQQHIVLLLPCRLYPCTLPSSWHKVPKEFSISTI